MILVRDKSTGAEIGTISDEQLQELVDHLEEESSDDADYYITRQTVDLLEEQTGDPDLIALLRKGLGDRQDMDIQWESA